MNVCGAAATLGLCWLALVGAAGPRPLEASVLDEVNYVREHPRQYADELRRYRTFFDGRVVRLPGDPVGKLTEEGTRSVDEAISFLDRQQPLPPLAGARVLALAARDLAAEQNETGQRGHRSSDGAMPGDRVRRYGGDIYVGETISYGYDDASGVVRQLIIDDGVTSRGHRALIFAPGNRYAGVGCGAHPQFGYMCVIDYGATATGAPALPRFASGR
jgi:uncharacterized protein YkwD